MSEISIKSFYMRADNSTEIRRFALPKEEAKNFNLLREKLVSVYNSGSIQETFNKNEIAIFWRDDEGDEVSISSDDELAYSLKAQSTDVFKINVRKIKCNPSSSARAKCYHPGVICDGCDKEIYGHRYKCMDCPNYDLCSSCDSKGNHNEHSMMRLVTPMKPNSRFRHYSSFNRSHHRAPKWHRNSDNGAAAGGDGPGGKRPCDGRRARFGEPFHPYNFLDRVWSALRSQIPTQQQQQQQQPNQQTENPSTSGAQNTDASAPPNEQNFNDEYLRHIGETVAGLLDPLGIDVLVDIENGGVRTTVRDNRNNKSKSDEEKSAPEESKMEEDDKPTADGETGVTENGAEAQTNNKKQDEQVPPTSAEDSYGDWTCLGQEIEESMRILPELLSQVHMRTESNAPINPESQQNPSPIDQMISMGFDNASNWLSSLITLCENDVGRVLELLADLGEANGPSRAFIEAFIALLEKHEGDAGKVVAIMRSIHQN